MRSDWKEYKLSKIIEIIGGGTPKTTNKDYWNGEIPWLSVVDFNNDDRYVLHTEKTITKVGLKNSSTKLLAEGQIIISARGTIGALAQLKYPMAFNQSCYGIKAREEFAHNDFIYYLLKNTINNLKQISHGAVFNTITRDTFNAIDVKVPGKDTQLKISKVLGSLDDKIANNNRLNQTLEEIAQALFKSWFVDFDPVKAKIQAKAEGKDPQMAAMMAISGKKQQEIQQLPQEKQNELAQTASLFPDKLMESELGLIPEGWELKPLYETAEYVNGGAFKTKDFSESKQGLPIIKIVELKSGLSSQTKYTEKNIPVKYKINNDDMLYSWSGSPETSLEVFKWYGGPGWLNQHIFKINTVRIEQKVFVYYLLKFLKPQLINIAKNKQTTGLGHVTVADMKRMQVVVPDDNSCQLIKNHFISLFEQVSNCMKQNSVLSQQRDTLLPKLLSGEIIIND